MKITYIVCSLFFDITMLILAIITPVYFTPGWYWWSAFCVILLMSSAKAFGERIDKWERA